MSEAGAAHDDLPSDPNAVFRAILAAGGRGGDLVQLYHRLRALAPVFQADFERLNHPWAVTRHADDELLVRNRALIKDDRQPYQQGMVFRQNLDGSEFETLGWNFRNNWMVTVDSFGAIWQSDNDDDGNRGTRINFVMEHGNYGYRDELTGAGWRESRITLEDEIPLQHWHLPTGLAPQLLHNPWFH